ncbi:helix-turn-helix domain-containing protein [Sphaerospermopsis aphanizomenoides BCCUSP55]|nr:helix-turn-helix domain-containing protein [Sphaerospermopsis aphanizomenoides BCCUSP55]
MLKAYKHRIYPTGEQSILRAKSFGWVRWFYNFALDLTFRIYKATGKG